MILINTNNKKKIIIKYFNGGLARHFLWRNYVLYCMDYKWVEFLQWNTLWHTTFSSCFHIQKWIKQMVRQHVNMLSTIDHEKNINFLNSDSSMFLWFNTTYCNPYFVYLYILVILLSGAETNLTNQRSSKLVQLFLSYKCCN